LTKKAEDSGNTTKPTCELQVKFDEVAISVSSHNLEDTLTLADKADEILTKHRLAGKVLTSAPEVKLIGTLPTD
jgi:hypothetical protein